MNQALYVEAVNIISKCFAEEKTFNHCYNKITEHIQELYESFKDKDSIEAIRRAVIEMFAQYGIKAIIVCKQSVSIKTSIMSRENNAYIMFLNIYLKEMSFKEKIEHSSPDKTKEAFVGLFEYVQTTTNITDGLLLKDIVRVAIKQLLKLNERDGIFFKKYEPYIKNFDFELVKSNAKIRELKRPSSFEEAISFKKKQTINMMLDGESIQGLIAKVVENIINEHLSTMHASVFIANFSFLFIREYAMLIHSIISPRLNSNNIDFDLFAPYQHNAMKSTSYINSNSDIDMLDINGYCIDIYRFNKRYVYESLAHTILDRVHQNNKRANEFVLFFNGQNKQINGFVIYVPNITNNNDGIWKLSDIRKILNTSYMINSSIKRHKDLLESSEKKVAKLEQQMNEQRHSITHKEVQIRALSSDYERKKIESNFTTNKDIETREAMSKIMGSISKEKISKLGDIAALNSKIASAKQKKQKELANQEKFISYIQEMKQDNVHNIQALQQLINSFSSCVEAVVTDIDDAV